MRKDIFILTFFPITSLLVSCVYFNIAMNAFPCVVFSLLFFLSTLSPIQAENTWIYPKPYTNPTFSSEDILEASWASDFSNPTLLLLCDFPGPPCESSVSEWIARRR